MNWWRPETVRREWKFCYCIKTSQKGTFLEEGMKKSKTKNLNRSCRSKKLLLKGMGTIGRRSIRWMLNQLLVWRNRESRTSEISWWSWRTLLRHRGGTTWEIGQQKAENSVTHRWSKSCGARRVVLLEAQSLCGNLIRLSAIAPVDSPPVGPSAQVGSKYSGLILENVMINFLISFKID